MIGIVMLILLLGVEIGLMVFRLITKSNQTIWKNKLRVGVFVGAIVLAVFPIIQVSFRWYSLYIILLIQAIISIVYLWKRAIYLLTNPGYSFSAI